MKIQEIKSQDSFIEFCETYTMFIEFVYEDIQRFMDWFGEDRDRVPFLSKMGLLRSWAIEFEEANQEGFPDGMYYEAVEDFFKSKIAQGHTVGSI